MSSLDFFLVIPAYFFYQSSLGGEEVHGQGSSFLNNPGMELLERALVSCLGDATTLVIRFKVGYLFEESHNVLNWWTSPGPTSMRPRCETYISDSLVKIPDPANLVSVGSCAGRCMAHWMQLNNGLYIMRLL